MTPIFTSTISNSVSSEESIEIANRLSQEIAERYGPRDENPLCILLHADEEKTELIGGLNAVENWKWLYIRQLYMREDHRGKGLGLQLMQMAEREAVTRGCQGIYIDTFDERTAVFYEERCGFSRCGKIENFPPGNSARVYLKKDLSVS